MCNKTAARREVGRRAKNMCCSLPQSLLFHNHTENADAVSGTARVRGQMHLRRGPTGDKSKLAASLARAGLEEQTVKQSSRHRARRAIPPTTPCMASASYSSASCACARRVAEQPRSSCSSPAPGSIKVKSTCSCNKLCHHATRTTGPPGMEFRS
jgi:hypothetical protein